MIKAQSLNELTEMFEKAAVKAMEVKPDIKRTDFREYEVLGSTYNVYKVLFGYHAGYFWAACTCKAGLGGLSCYHAAAALDLHLEEVENRREEKERIERNKAMDNAPLLKSSSEKPVEKIAGIRI